MSDAKVVIVAGAAGNLGRAVGKLLAAQDCSIIAVDRGAETLRTLIEGWNGPDRHLPIADADLGMQAACDAMVETTLNRYGRLDGLVNTVGGFAMAPVADIGSNAWQLMYKLNVEIALNLFRAVLPPMEKARRGSLVAIGAGAALKGSGNLSAYAASKAALMRLVESLAEEVKGAGVRVNAVMPSTIDTPQNRSAMPDADFSRWVTPEELAETIAFLMSDRSSGITGALIPVYGRV